MVAAVTALNRTGVALADGARVDPQAVICATGYRPGLEPLVGHLGVLDEGGMPKVIAPRPAAPGLRFGGYVLRPGIGYMGKQARRTARSIAREIGSGRSGERPGREEPARAALSRSGHLDEDVMIASPTSVAPLEQIVTDLGRSPWLWVTRSRSSANAVATASSMRPMPLRSLCSAGRRASTPASTTTAARAGRRSYAAAR